jgi:hypothetical protein
MKNTMTTRRRDSSLGSWAFTIGVVIAVLLGALGGSLGEGWQQWLTVGLIVIGLIVGFFNVTGDEAMSFLTTTAILVVVMYTGGQTLEQFSSNWVLNVIKSIFQSLNLLFVPATLVVAVKTVFALARD